MKASKFTDAQKAFIIRQGEEGTAVAEICRKAGISQATYFNWKKKYGGLMPSEMKRLRELEEENGRLKRIVADLSLDKEMLRGTSSSEKCKACRQAQAGGWDAHRLEGAGAPGMRCSSLRSVELPLPIPPPRSGHFRKTDEGNLCRPRSLWLSSRARAAQSRGLGA